MSNNNTIPVADMLDNLASTARAMEHSGEGFGCVVVLLVDKQGGWAGGVGGEQALDLSKLLLNVRDSLVAGEKSFTLFTKRENAAGESEPLRANGGSHG